MTSDKAVRPKDLGTTRAAETRIANSPATAPSHTLFRLLKTVLSRHFRWDLEVTLVTVVTRVWVLWTESVPGPPGVYSNPHLPVSFSYSIICSKAATVRGVDAIESSARALPTFLETENPP